LCTNSNTPDYHEIIKFISKEYVEQNEKTGIVTKMNLNHVRRGESPKIFYELPEDVEIIIKYDNSDVACYLRRISKDHGLQDYVDYLCELTLCAKNKSVIDKLLFAASEPEKVLSVWRYDSKNSCWRVEGEIQERDEDTLILRLDDKEKLFEDIEIFNDSKEKEDYKKYGIIYKKTIYFMASLVQVNRL
jgi:hypothetical protein